MDPFRSLRSYLIFISFLASAKGSSVLRCSSPNALAQGQITTTDGTYKVGTVVHYKCNNDFQLQGATQRTCNHDGKWSGEDPRCDPRDECHKHLNRRCHEHAHCKKIDSNYKCVCNPGFRGDGFECGNKRPKDECHKRFHHACHKDGFCHRISEGKHECRCRDGFSGDGFSCRAIVCQKPEGIENGKLDANRNLFVPGNIITYRCNEKYSMNGNSQRRCLKSGQWSGKKPRCLVFRDKEDECQKRNRQTCHEFADCQRISNENYKCQCRSGYKGDGIYCQDAGCKRPNEPTHGRILSGQDKFVRGNVITYQCDNGYELMGNQQRTCVENGRWSNAVPRCEKKAVRDSGRERCQRPQEIPHGNMNINNSPIKVGTVATYTCRDPYKLQGQSQRTCQSDGSWSGDTPKCKVKPTDQPKAKCQRPREIPNGDIMLEDYNMREGSIVTYKCRHPYKLEGASQRTCQANGEWSGKAPKCKGSGCQRPVDPTHGKILTGQQKFVLGNTITYQCDHGYELMGNKQRSCMKNGRWSGQDPRCEMKSSEAPKAKCQRPQEIPNGHIMVGDHNMREGSIVTYQCKHPYKLVGASQRTCEANGAWSGKEPKCKEISKKCQKPQGIAHGMYSPKRKKYKPGKTVTYKCDEGFVLKGESRRTCKKSGQWSGSEPRCEKPNECEKEGRVCHKNAECRKDGDRGYQCICRGMYTGDGYNCHERQKDECEKRHHRRCHQHADCRRVSEGKYECKCRDGYYGDGVHCEDRSCQRPSDIWRGKILTGQSRFVKGNIISYQCDHGYKLIGTEQRTCLEDGRWSDSEPRCEEIRDK